MPHFSACQQSFPLNPPFARPRGSSSSYAEKLPQTFRHYVRYHDLTPHTRHSRHTSPPTPAGEKVMDQRRGPQGRGDRPQARSGQLGDGRREAQRAQWQAVPRAVAQPAQPGHQEGPVDRERGRHHHEAAAVAGQQVGRDRQEASRTHRQRVRVLPPSSPACPTATMWGTFTRPPQPLSSAASSATNRVWSQPRARSPATLVRSLTASPFAPRSLTASTLCQRYLFPYISTRLLSHLPCRCSPPPSLSPRFARAPRTGSRTAGTPP